MSLAEVVVNRFHLQASLFNQTSHVVAMVHFTVAVGHCGEIKARHSKAEGSCFKALPIPHGFHDIQAAVVIHDLSGATHDADDFVFTEAVEELAHPDGVVVLVGREGLGGVQ